MLYLALMATMLGEPSLPFLSPVFGDHMVLQRQTQNVFWGWTRPGASVTVRIGDVRGAGTADAAGRWEVRLMPPPPGGPYKVVVEGPERKELQDVLVGDVWICSGQSNMEMGIASVKNGPAEVAASTDPKLRIFMVPRMVAEKPLSLAAGTWRPVTPETLADGGWGGFSAVGYFFGRELRRRLDVPIGLVQAAWGGTIAEAWVSRESLMGMPDFARAIRARESAPTAEPYELRLERWYAVNGGEAPKSNAGWVSANLPITYEKNGMADFDGIVWIRRTFSLDRVPDGESELSLGPIDDADVTWINGTEVGRTAQYDAPRKYRVPRGLLKPGANELMIRVLDTGAAGGMTGTEGDVSLKLGDGTAVPLAGGGAYFKGKAMSELPAPPIREEVPNVPTVLYNGMIAPMTPLAVKGAIWYQGESNVGRAVQYQTLLPTLIQDWRRQFRNPEMPFFIVQLANFMARAKEPGDDAWAELREAQAIAATKVPKAGLAVTIDVGDALDIHPTDKLTVGYRLSRAALGIAYGQRIVYSGPVYRRMTTEGSRLRLHFDHAEGLRSEGGAPAGFAIRGEDGRLVWATARIDGKTVVLEAPGVAKPTGARYAWAANPEANVYNGAGLPMVPFRTDR